MKPLRNSIHKFLKSAEVTFFEGLYRDYFTRTLFPDFVTTKTAIL